MSAFVVKIGRLYVRPNPIETPERGDASGWRPVIWAKKLIDAEKFSDRSSATVWAKTWLLHDDFVVAAAAGERPPGGGGGARRAAA